MNEYFNSNGTLVSFPRISASFVTKAKKEELKPEASFEAEFAVVFKDYTVSTCGNDILISARINDYAAQAVEFTKNYNVE